MSTWTRSVALAASVIALTLSACGCDSAPGNPSATRASAPGPIVVLSAAETARLPAVLAERRADHFSRSALVRSNARIFLSLAETASDPHVATAALRALLTTWTHSERYATQLQRLTPEYAQVVALRLDDERPAVQAAALEAAVKCVLGDAPDARVLDQLVRLAGRDSIPPLRLAALEALSSSSGTRAHPAQMAPFVQALDAREEWLVSAALFRLAAFGAAWPDQGSLRAALRRLLAHADPGVRGRAATALSNVVGAEDPERDDVARALLPLLGDAHPFPRSAAATALAWLDFRPAVHALVPLLDDTASNTYDLRGYTRLDGTPGFIHHDGSPWSRVDDAAVRALQSFSARVGTHFAFDIQQGRVEVDFAVATSAARAWYVDASGGLPPRPQEPAL